MKADRDRQVYYTANGERHGPVSFDLLQTKCSAGEVDRFRDTVWWDGLPDWVAAGEVEGLFSTPPPPVAPAAASPGTRGAGPVYRAGRKPKKASFGLLLSLLIPACVLSVLTYIMLFVGFVYEDDVLEAAALFGIFAGVVGAAAAVVWCIYVYRMWQIVEVSTTRATPAQAVGFLFIPLFNLYWVFQVFYGWAQDYNSLTDVAGLRDAPRMPSSLFLAFCILTVLSCIPFLNCLVVLPLWLVAMVMACHMCRGINYFATAA